MRLDYVPLLKVQRDLHDLPRGIGRFRQYLRTIQNSDGTGLDLPPLVIMNPMGKEHVAARLDALLALDADGIGAIWLGRYRPIGGLTGGLQGDPRDRRRPDGRLDQPPRLRIPVPVRPRSAPASRPGSPGESRHAEVVGYPVDHRGLWSSEVPSECAVREALLSRSRTGVAYVQRHGPARTLREMIAQEGYVMAISGGTPPDLDAEDIAYTVARS